MKLTPSCTLIISTYNTSDKLRRCLQSVLKQQVMPSEIIIADDGSGDDTKKVIDEIATVSVIPIIRVWQPDEGFRLARIRNKAFLKASGEYIISIDGDILLNKNFIHDHLRFACYGHFIAGERAFLNIIATQKYLDEQNGFPSFFTKYLQKRIHALRCFLIAKIYCFVRHSIQPYLYVIGCNMSFWKSDLLKINGYNEAFCGWGSEDVDVAVRLFNSGVKQRFLQFYAIAFHLYHPENDRSSVATNDMLFRQSIANKTTYVEQGIDKHTTDE